MKVDIIDYVLLSALVILVVGSAFGWTMPGMQPQINEWITILLVAFGFKKAPQVLGG